MKPVYSVRKRLKQIYTAKQCTDIKDVEDALNSLRELFILTNGIGTYIMNRRLYSLHEKMKSFKDSKES